MKKKKKLKKKKIATRIGNQRKDTSLQLDSAIQDAINLHIQGQEKEAHRILGKLLETKNNDPILLNKTGYLAHVLGESSLALELLSQSVRLHPTAPFHNNLGYVQEQLGLIEDAQNSYMKALKLDPAFATAHYNLANIYQYKSQNVKAVEHYQQAIHLKSDYVEAYNNLANAHLKLGNNEQALHACVEAIRLNPFNTEAIKTWSAVSFQIEEPVDIVAKCELNLGFVENKSHIFLVLGNVLAGAGMKKQAWQAYRKALITSDRPGPVYYRMSLLWKPENSDPVIEEMKHIYSTYQDPENKGLICFALGRVHEETGGYHDAFQYFAEGNKTVRGTYSYSIVSDRNSFSKLQNTFTSQHIHKLKECGVNDSTPIFIVGMPRSGTTLAEQVLASHSSVHAAGELNELNVIIKNTVLSESGQQVPHGLEKLGCDSFKRIGTEYISRIRRLDRDAMRIIDKKPHNFLWLGIIHLALPNAKIIHCRRNPVDTCWSIYKNIFRVPHRYAQDLVELGQYYRLYEDLMNHWKDVLGNAIFEFQYEALIQDQEAQTRKLLEFCNLPWENKCLNFHMTKRQINTSSLAQVRKPLYRDSVDKWKQYENELKPLTDILSNTS